MLPRIQPIAPKRIQAPFDHTEFVFELKMDGSERDSQFPVMPFLGVGAPRQPNLSSHRVSELRGMMSACVLSAVTSMRDSNHRCTSLGRISSRQMRDREAPIGQHCIKGRVKHQGKTNVLIVDNDERVLMTFQELLENEGFNTVSTWSGQEALSLLRSGRFDVLLVDDYLPDLHAHDFLKRVGSLPIQPWVVVMQASTPTSTELRRYEWLGATTVVDKSDSGRVRQAVYQCCVEEPLTLLN